MLISYFSISIVGKRQKQHGNAIATNTGPAPDSTAKPPVRPIPTARPAPRGRPSRTRAREPSDERKPNRVGIEPSGPSRHRIREHLRPRRACRPLPRQHPTRRPARRRRAPKPTGRHSRPEQTVAPPPQPTPQRNRPTSAPRETKGTGERRGGSPETGRRWARSPGCGERRGEEDDGEVETRERSGQRGGERWRMSWRNDLVRAWWGLVAARLARIASVAWGRRRLGGSCLPVFRSV